MFSKRSVASAAISLFALTASLQANSIAGIFNTGTTGGSQCIGTSDLSAGCSLLSVGSTDTHYAVTGPVGPPATTAAVASNPAAGWLGANTTSRWIRPNNGSPNLAGTYVYTQSFTLASVNTPISIIGQWATDNGATLQVNLNGTVASTTTNTFNLYHLFDVSNNPAFVVGLNTLTFTVTNTAPSPTGLRVEFLSASVPEPLEAISLVGMVAGLLVVGRRRLMA